MHRSTSTWTLALSLSFLALLSLLSRTFIDYHVVYQEIGLAGSGFAYVTLFNLALFAGWIWALVAASHANRAAWYVLLAYDLLLVVFGVATQVSFCPSPCRTAWPVGEIATWSNLVIGVPAAVLVSITLFRQPAS